MGVAGQGSEKALLVAPLHRNLALRWRSPVGPTLFVPTGLCEAQTVGHDGPPAAVEPSAITQRLKATATESRVATLLFRERQAAQAMVEAVADLANVPITLCKRPTPERFFKALQQRGQPLPFSDVLGFHDFIEKSQADSAAAIHELARDRLRWRPVFEVLERQLIVVRGRRSEPIVKTLRDHWPWRWLELASLYHDTVLAPPKSGAALSWQTDVSDGLLHSRLISIGRSASRILIGPVRLRTNGDYQPDVALMGLVSWFYGTLRPDLEPIYPAERLSQFVFSRPPLEIEDFDLICQKVARAIEILSGYDAGGNERLDLADFQSASLFAYLLSSLASDKKFRSVLGPDELLIAASYDTLLVEERHIPREHVFRGRLAKLEGVSLAKTRDLTGATADRALVVRPRLGGKAASDTAQDIVRRELSSLWSAGQLARAQLNLEELLLLRYKLSDNFGVLTASGSSQVQHSLEQNADKELGRRIAREIAEITCGSSTVIYRLDYIESHLSMVGAWVETKNKRAPGDGDYAWMSDLGHDAERRPTSVSYHAADRDRATTFGASVAGAKLVDRVTAQAHPPVRSLVPTAGSILAVPIRVFGRVWGVIEVLSPRSEWFSVADLEILQRIADLIGPYYHEHDLMRLLYRMAAAPARDASEAAFDDLAAQLREMMLSDACCVWISDVLNSEEFVLAGCSGRPDLPVPADADAPRISKSAKNSVSMALLRKKQAWQAGTLGRAPFDELWSAKPHTRELRSAGFTHIALLPVAAEGSSRQAVVSLYSRQSSYSDGWQNWGSFIAGYLSVLFNRILNVAETERQARRLVAHEINNAVRILRQSSKKVFEWSRSSPAVLPTNFENWRSDITNYLGFIEQLMASWAEAAPEADWRPELILLSSLEQLSKSTLTKPTSVRSELNSALQSQSKELRRRAIETSTSLPRGDLDIRMHPEALRMVLANLSSNAIKYSSQGGLIRFEGSKGRYGYSLTMSNLGRELGEGEAQRLFDMGFRGYAARGKIDGNGLGLYIAKKVCGFYGIVLTYDRRPGNRPGQVWHMFSLAIPNERVAS